MIPSKDNTVAHTTARTEKVLQKHSIDKKKIPQWKSQLNEDSYPTASQSIPRIMLATQKRYQHKTLDVMDAVLCFPGLSSGLSTYFPFTAGSAVSAQSLALSPFQNLPVATGQSLSPRISLHPISG